MVNWTGVYTNSNSIGTSTGSNGSNTLNDTGASWPDLVNQYVQITAGLGIGQERKILSTLSTQITIVGSWDIIPDNTSQYKIILRLDDGDHIVGTTYLYPGVYSELEDNATIYIDGNYQIIIADATEVLWNKSRDTLVTFEANNRDIQGKYGFWLGILFDNIATGTVKISYLKIRDASIGFRIEPSVALNDGSDIHHIILEECSSYPFAMYSIALLEDVIIKNILSINCKDNCYYNAVENIYSLTFENFWLDGGIRWYGATSARTQILKNSVILGMTSQASTINNANKNIYIIDNYLKGYIKDIYLIYPGAGEKGIISCSRNISKLGRELLNASTDIELIIYSRYNDYIANGTQTYYAIEDFATGAETIISHSDFIAGRKLAVNTNIDLTELTTSNHTPAMYVGLSSARTNAKSVPNKLLELDNIRESDLTSNSIKIKFDCKNSHTGTVVDQDSTSGQKILYITDTADFELKETVEIGFGTARQEEGIIDSIQAAVSITLEENLTYSHTQVQTDTVKKKLRNLGLGFIKYGISADDLNMATYIPNKKSWGYLFNGFIPEITTDDGYEWKYIDFEIDLTELDYNTKYYYQVCAYSPLEDLMVGSISDFTTAALPSYTDPGITNVRLTTGYTYAGDSKVGTLDLPAIEDVRDGTFYDNTTKEGLLDLPLESKVEEGIIFDNTTKTGTLDAGLTPQNIQDIADAVLDENVNDHTTEGSFGALLRRMTGMNQENYKVYDTVWSNGLMTESKIKIYPSKTDLENDTNTIASYQVTTTYSDNKLLYDYSCKRLT